MIRDRAIKLHVWLICFNFGSEDWGIKVLLFLLYYNIWSYIIIIHHCSLHASISDKKQRVSGYTCMKWKTDIKI